MRQAAEDSLALTKSELKSAREDGEAAKREADEKMKTAAQAHDESENAIRIARVAQEAAAQARPEVATAEQKSAQAIAGALIVQKAAKESEELTAARLSRLETHSEVVCATAWRTAAVNSETLDSQILSSLKALIGVIAQDSISAWAHQAEGIVLFRMSDYPAAIVALEKAVTILTKKVPNQEPHATILASPAMAHHQLGHSEKATSFRQHLDAAMQFEQFSQ